MTQGPCHVILSSECTNWHCPDGPPPGLHLLPSGPQQDRAGGHTQTHNVTDIMKAWCSLRGGDLNEWACKHLREWLGCSRMESYCSCCTEVNLIITLLLEVDVILLPEPGVGQVARIRLRLAGEECILGYVDGDVLRWRHDVRRPYEEQRQVLEFIVQFFGSKLT